MERVLSTTDFTPVRRTPLDSLRYHINRRFPLRLVNEFSKIHVDEGSVLVDDAFLHGLSNDEIKSYFRNSANEGLSYGVAHMVKLLGLRRKTARAIMTEALVRSLEGDGEVLGYNIINLFRDEGINGTVGGSDIGDSMERYLRTSKQLQEIEEPPLFARFLDRIL